MVMKKNITTKNLLRTIRGSLGRYVAILAIIALGASIFVGLLTAKSDMVETGQQYMDKQNMFDLRLLSTYGWTQKEVDAVAQMAGVSGAEGSVCMDVIGRKGDTDKDLVYKVHSIPQNINKVMILGGTMPAKPNECLVDGAFATEVDLGTTFTVSQENSQNTLDSLKEHTYTVVGYVSTPLYMDMSRGSTSLGTGQVASYLYIPMEAFDVDYYTEIGVTLEGDYAIYTETYNKAMENMAESLKPDVSVLANDRFATVKDEAEKEFADGWKEYEDGLADYESARKEVLSKLDEGLKKLQDAQSELDGNRLKVEEGLKQLEDGQKQLDEQAQTLYASRNELNSAKAAAYEQMAKAAAELAENNKKVSDGLAQVNSGLSQLDSGMAQITDGINKLEDGLSQIADGISKLETGISLKQIEIKTVNAALEAAKLAPELNKALVEELEKRAAELEKELGELQAQLQELKTMQATYTAQLEELKKQKEELTAKRTELVKTKTELEAALAAIEEGYRELQYNQIQADNKFAAAEAQLESGQVQLEDAQKKLNAKKAELDAATEALAQAQTELDGGWKEYESEKAKAEEGFAEAQAELDEGKTKLMEARETIDKMEPAEVFVLDRNTNIGYLSLDSNSDIVAGVSRVFPAFFLLVAAMVCITTMTRMVEEERTQIGTMKALGFSNGAIIRKYLIYAGSAAVIGCGLGVILGSIIFPLILWNAYGIILNITPRLVLQINWWLCLAVVAAYATIMLLVTYYCCRKSLKEVPAELIRAKEPTAGKKMLLERLPFWKNISFLNKVMLRNVVRYRQRMLMMLLGVGGCTALLVTGFGLKDSIVHIVSNQFDDVTTYDMEVYFSEEQNEEQRQKFREDLSGSAADMVFFYQSSAELRSDEQTQELYLMSAGENIQNFIHFHHKDEKLSMPGVGEVYLSIGAAECAGVKVGDTITLHGPDLWTLELKVTGIFDNYVYNYAIVLPETLKEQWGYAPDPQMAMVNVQSGRDIYEVSAEISGREEVLNVSVSQDLENQVSGMMDAMNAIVVTVVICAGTLAVIVLYNLTNINITERLREIATLKVLGFYPMESASYVFKENLLLSGMGTLVGLLGGKLLLNFVMDQIKVNMVWFRPQVAALSFVLAVVLTMLSACLVDFLLYFKLGKINMTEALKSVE